jgi:hypothetical protein
MATVGSVMKPFFAINPYQFNTFPYVPSPSAKQALPLRPDTDGAGICSIPRPPDACSPIHRLAMRVLVNSRLLSRNIAQHKRLAYGGFSAAKAPDFISRYTNHYQAHVPPYGAASALKPHPIEGFNCKH